MVHEHGIQSIWEFLVLGELGGDHGPGVLELLVNGYQRSQYACCQIVLIALTFELSLSRLRQKVDAIRQLRAEHRCQRVRSAIRVTFSQIADRVTGLPEQFRHINSIIEVLEQRQPSQSGDISTGTLKIDLTGCLSNSSRRASSVFKVAFHSQALFRRFTNSVFLVSMYRSM